MKTNGPPISIGYSVKETAKILNISEVAVKKRLQRAREILSELGREYDGGIVCEQ